jgi:membrane protease YdiL (CAAX protease family)
VRDEQEIWDEPAFLAVTLATLGAAVVAGWIGAAALNAQQRYDAMQLTVMLASRETITLLVLDFSATRYLRITWADLGLRRIRWHEVVVGAVLGVVAAVSAAALLAVLDLNGEPWTAGAAATGTLPWRLAVVAMVGVYSPVVQEIVFRGLLLRGLLQRANAMAAVAVSAVIFGLAHAASGTGAVINSFIFGVLAGVLFVRFRSLTAPIAAHVAVNSGVMIHAILTVHRPGL